MDYESGASLLAEIERLQREKSDSRAWLTVGALEARLGRLTREVERLQMIVRVNELRWGHTHAEIDAILDGSPKPDGHEK